MQLKALEAENHALRRQLARETQRSTLLDRHQQYFTEGEAGGDPAAKELQQQASKIARAVHSADACLKAIREVNIDNGAGTDATVTAGMLYL